MTIPLFPVPIIAVFTKYEQFKYNVEMELEDRGLSEAEVQREAPKETEEKFEKYYLGTLESSKGRPRFVRLER